MHPELGPIATLVAVSLILPLPWHWRARNIATLAIIAWLFVSNVIYAVDAFVWSDNVEIVLPVWCDISTKIMVGANFALPAACFCICIHLEQVSSARYAQRTLADRKKRMIFESFMCFGVPIIFMALHYIVQGHRYDIYEGYGCRPSIYVSILAIFIIWIPPILMAAGALVFAGLALRHFVRRRVTFATHLNSSNTALTTSRYLRLMLMSAFQMVWSITITCFNLGYTILAIPIRPWTTWADVHSNFSRVDQYPAILFPSKIDAMYYAIWWMIPTSSIAFVAFFSFGKDAMEEYKKCFMWIRRNIFHQNTETEGKFKNLSFPNILISNPFCPKSPVKTERSTVSPPPIYEAPQLSVLSSPSHIFVNNEHKIQHESSIYEKHSIYSFSNASDASHSPTDSFQELHSSYSAQSINPPTPSGTRLLLAGQSFLPVSDRVKDIETHLPSSHVVISAPSCRPSAPRPFTFPSFEASHADIPVFNPYDAQ